MIELRTLGAIDLRNGTGARIDSVLLHTKRLSLLVYLCTSDPVQVQRRDTLVALLWPELDAAHARGALRHELSQLRRALGGDALRGTGVEAVGVNGEQIWCDACAFEAALAADRPAVALELWRGEFLPGLHVPGGEFDRWVDGMRDRLARRAMEAADRLRVAAEERGDLPGAVRWARRRAELAPYDEPAWHGLLAALDRAGDRAGALAAYNTLVTRLRDELEVDPAPETRALADRIRGRMEAQPAVAANSSGQANDDANNREELALYPLAPAAPRLAVIAVRPVENLTGDSRHDVLAHRLTDRLIQGLAELHFISFIAGDDVSGATAAVSATLYARSARVEVRTRLAACKGGQILAVPEPVLLHPSVDDACMDSIVARVLAAVATQYHPDVATAIATGRPLFAPSWPAFLDYIQGSEAFGAFRYEQAARQLERAYEIDPGFLKAAIFAGIARAFAGDPAGADALVTAAMNRVAIPNPYDWHFGEWFLADLHGRRPEAYRAAMEVIRLTSHPVLVGIAAREALRMNRPAETARLLLGTERVEQGLGWWRNRAEAYEWLSAAFHLLGDHLAELREVLWGRGAFPESLEVIRAETRARAALGEPTVALALVEEAFTLPSALVSPADVAWAAAQELVTHGDAEAGAAARRAGLAWLAQRDAPSNADRLLWVRLLLETGDLLVAHQHLAALGSIEGLEALEALGLGGLLAAHTGDTDTACHLLAQLENQCNPYLSGRHLLLAAGIRAALDQPELALDTLRRAFAAGLPFSVELHALPMLRPLSPRADFIALLRPRG